MTGVITLKTKDICAALGIGRHQLRQWTCSLPPYSKYITQERSARRFDTADLYFFALIQHIESHFGVNINQLAKFSENIWKVIREPIDITEENLIFIDLKLNKCKRIEDSHEIDEGIIIDTSKAKRLVGEYFGLPSKQIQFHFGLAKVS